MLSPALRVEALEAIRIAFLDTAFVARHVGTAVDLMGEETVVGLLPDRAEPIRTLAAALADRSLDQSKRLLDRADLAERGERAAALRRLEELDRRGDKKAVSEGCAATAAAYPAERFDDREGRQETARVLELWPTEPGAWESDPRASLVRFLLDGSEDAPNGRRFAAPPPHCRTYPLPSAQKFFCLRATGREPKTYAPQRRQPPHTTGSPTIFGWSARICGAGIWQQRGGHSIVCRPARGTPATRCWCGSKWRRSRRKEPRRLTWSDAWMRFGLESGDADNWLRNGRLRMCIEPSTGVARSLAVGLKAAAPAVVAYGWDQGRAGTLLVSDERVLVLPLTVRPGSRIFWFATLAGGPVMPRETSIR